jgi:AraC-like DNA-binding protein
MRYRELAVRPPFDRIVECVWRAEAPDGAAGEVQRILPDGCAELIVQRGDRFRAGGADGTVERQGRAVLVGELTRPWLVQAEGRVDTVGVRFRPAGLGALVEAPLRGLTDRATAIDDVWGAAGRELEARVQDAAGDDGIVAAIEGFLGTRARRAPDPLAEAVCAAIRRERGQLALADLARSAGCSTREVQRRVLRAVGLGPKRLSRIVRLQEVLRRLRAAEAAWVDVALDCGYYDQSHLARDFRELAGLSPERYLRQHPGPLASQFTSRERLEVFFAG